MRLKLAVKFFSQIHGKDLSTFQVHVLFFLFFLSFLIFVHFTVILQQSFLCPPIRLHFFAFANDVKARGSQKPFALRALMMLSLQTFVH